VIFATYIYYPLRIGVQKLKTTILVEHETRQFLREIGKKGQTYDGVINDLAKKAGLKDQREALSITL
jgi:hypothetical protein